MKTKRELVIVRGGGDIATGTIQALKRAGYDVLILETEKPSAIRRQVALSEAVYDGTSTVEDVTCVYCHTDGEAQLVMDHGNKVVHLSRQKIRYFLMNFMLLHNQLTRLDNTSQPAYDGGWKNGFVQNCKCGYSA